MIGRVGRIGRVVRVGRIGRTTVPILIFFLQEVNVSSLDYLASVLAIILYWRNFNTSSYIGINENGLGEDFGKIGREDWENW